MKSTNHTVGGVICLGYVFLPLSIYFAFMVFVVIAKLKNPAIASGWTSLIASIYLVGGLLMVNIGVVGLYIGNIFNEVKRRPLYLVRDILNREEEKE